MRVTYLGEANVVDHSVSSLPTDSGTLIEVYYPTEFHPDNQNMPLVSRDAPIYRFPDFDYTFVYPDGQTFRVVVEVTSSHYADLIFIDSVGGRSNVGTFDISSPRDNWLCFVSVVRSGVRSVY